MNDNLTLTEINIYPIKSMGGISLEHSEAGERGLKYDRRFLLVDENNMFLTQRDYPQMAFLKLKFAGEGFIIYNIKSTADDVFIPFSISEGGRRKVKIWNDECEAIAVDEKINEWLSRFMRFKCRLVYMPDSTEREVEKDYGVKDKTVSFADAYPYLIIGQSSLDDLNARLETPVPMNRFRTNFVFEGGKAFCEDEWDEFIIGEVKFKRVKPCARCVITTTDQQTGERGAEPLKTLSTYRKINNKVMFGQNLIALNGGKVKCGDRIVLP